MRSAGWRTWEFRAVMNSAPGAEDGIFEMYVDGIEQTNTWSNNLDHADGSGMNLSTIDWIDGTLDPEQPTVTGFNCFSLGGNADFNWDGQTPSEQWFYSFRNVQVSTSRLT